MSDTATLHALIADSILATSAGQGLVPEQIDAITESIICTLLNAGEQTYHESTGIGRGLLTRWSSRPPRMPVLVLPLTSEPA